MTFSLVVACDEQRGIGKDGDMPWHLPGDMKHFRQVTQRCDQPGRQNAVVMGRRTWQSIPDKFRPLVGRVNVVLTRNSEFPLPAEVVRASDGLEAAIARLAAPPLSETVGDIFVIGGGSVYVQAIAMADCRELYVTRIHRVFDCDTSFPEFEHAFDRTASLGEGADGDVRYTFERWTRREALGGVPIDRT